MVEEENDDNELREAFIEEAKEYLNVLNKGLLTLETSKDDPDLIHSIFRAAHSLKGNAALIELHDIKNLSHSLESVFDAIREGTISYSEKMYDTLFKVVDKLSFMVEQVINGEPVTKDYSPLIKQLDSYSDPSSPADQTVGESTEPEAGVVEEDSAICSPEVIKAFCDDTGELLDSLEEDLFSLEKHPCCQETIASVFTRIHSLNAGASFLHLEFVCEISQALEDLISPLKENSAPMELSGLVILGFLFEGVHLLTHALQSHVDPKDSVPDYQNFISELENFTAQFVLGAPPPSSSREEEAKKAALPSPLPESSQPTDKTAAASIRVSAKKLDDTIKLMGEMISNQAISKQKFALHKEAEKLSRKSIQLLTSIVSETHSGSTLQISPAKGLIGLVAIEEQFLDPGQVVNILHMQKTSNLRFGDAAISLGYLNKSDLTKLVEFQKSRKPLQNTREELKKIKKKLKDVFKTAELLDQAVKKIVRSGKDFQLVQEILTSDLQDKALKMRMLPLSTVFNTFTRFVRNTAKVVNKKVELDIQGGETEIDKKILEKINDPLIHMIRNSIDHGIEKKDVRLKMGKPEMARIKLKGGYEGNTVVIDVSDDGSGINPAAVRKKAEEREIYPKEVLEEMSSEQITNLIFHPGFSTSETITEISGRGVGLDIVKKNIVEDLKGAIEITTAENKGTTFHVRLPITLALIRLLNIMISDHPFSIPLNYVSEIVRIPSSKLLFVVEKLAFILADRIIPIITLNTILGITTPAKTESNLLIVVVKIGSEIVGVLVDQITGEEDTVIKSLPPHMKNFPLVSGVKISADNEVVNVLHLPNILKIAKGFKTENPSSPKKEDHKSAPTILLVDDSAMARKHEKNVLEQEGFAVDTATNAFEGIHMLRESNYDLIITDIEMPDKDGFTFTHELKVDKAFRHVPIIIASSLDKNKFRERAKEVGADAYIVKKDFHRGGVSELVKTLIHQNSLK